MKPMIMSCQNTRPVAAEDRFPVATIIKANMNDKCQYQRILSNENWEECS